MENPVIPFSKVTKTMVLINVLMAIIYFGWWFIPSHIGNIYLYSLLFFGEIYHILMAFTFWYTIWPRSEKVIKFGKNNYFPRVTVFITVAGEPVDLVLKTASAARDLEYPNHEVWILNDGFVAKKENWYEIEQLAERLGINCITRERGGGAKAGNINNALKHTDSELVAIFDADMVPEPDFLKKTVPYFENIKVGFVQTPQYYVNNKKNNITGGAWEQQSFFFGPIMVGKDTKNSAFICGTNVVIRKKTLLEVGGMNEKNIAEDFLTSLFIHQKKWQSFYIKEILAQGLAPEDLLSYIKQQNRWARGSLELLFRFNPFLRRGLTFSQRIHYFSSALFYLNGLIVLIDCLIPLFYLFFGIQAVSATTTSFALFFIPYIFLSLYTIFRSSGGGITFRAISFTQSSFLLQIQALASLIFSRKTEFIVTPKKEQQGNFLFLIYPHLAYCAVSLLGIIIALFRYGFNPSVVTNSAWVLFNIFMFLPFISAGYTWKTISLFNLPLITRSQPHFKNKL